MAKQSRNLPSNETQEQALKIARSTQRPGQTKEQTKLIAQGIEKGIQNYKKQQKSRSRELNKKLKHVSRQVNDEQPSEQQVIVKYKQHWLPWILLLLTWVGMVAYYFVEIRN
jgi:ATP-dependent Zn protease